METESFTMATPIGRIRVDCCENKVSEINLGLNKTNLILSEEINTDKSISSYGLKVKEQIQMYFSNALILFDLNIYPRGTVFQQSVWTIISSIKVGETVTYSDIAESLNSSPRAVGNACRANPVPVIVPCHRVVSKAGIGGFAGERDGNNINVKQWLLEHEAIDYKINVA